MTASVRARAATGTGSGQRPAVPASASAASTPDQHVEQPATGGARDRRTAQRPHSGGRRPHVLLVASTGGHLAQLLALRPWWATLDRTWVTFDKADARSTLAGEHVRHAYHPTTRNLPNAVRNLRLAARLVRDVRPDLVVSTGAGVAVPFFAIARAHGIPTVFLEVYDRVDTRTLTGRMCRPLASAFCTQWPEQVAMYPGSEVVGTLL